jgi:xanthine dehydrogenase small subunit
MSQATNSVRFVLDGQIIEAQGKRRTTTVLDFLREQMQRTGTKEGCAEGDCGACVVLMGELNDAQTAIHYVPVNSCMQLLPSLDGKSIKTVESLKRSDGTLHPVQQEMVDCFGSQCGFCTPGIIMALTGMVQINSKPSRDDVNNALAGNLCRCTGYKPIVDATLKACQRPAADLKVQDSADLPLLKEIARAKQPTVGLDGQIILQPVVRTRKGSEFVAPATLEEVAQYLVEHPDATLLAGSTEIGLQVNKQFSRPKYICFVANVDEMRQVKETATSWQIGASVPLEQIMHLMVKPYPDFAEVIRRFGSPPIRSTATLAGNIANGSPIGDTMPCLMAMNAMLHLRKANKTRTVPLHEFYTGMKTNILQASEFITAVEIPKPKTNEIFKAHKISKRFDQDISATCAAMQFHLVQGQLKSVRIAYNGLSQSPCRAPKLEAVLEGKNMAAGVTPEIIAALDAAITDSFPARDGLRATWAYRSLVARNLVLQFLEDSIAPPAITLKEVA